MRSGPAGAQGAHLLVGGCEVIEEESLIFSVALDDGHQLPVVRQYMI